MIQEHDTVAVNRDLKEAGIIAGDIGVVVHVYSGSHMAEVEFVTGEGATIAARNLVIYRHTPDWATRNPARPLIGNGLTSGTAATCPSRYS